MDARDLRPSAPEMNKPVSQNWPFNLIEYRQRTREPNPADYVFL